MKSAKIDTLLKPIERFMHAQSTAGIVLLVSALGALIWSNSPWQEYYYHLWEYKLSVTLGDYSIEKSLHQWINDGLMAMFFFVVGLELKREIIAGELSSVRKALLPLMAAVGGMLVPALIFVFFNRQGPGIDGWGIPMATDIAFALGIIALLGNRIPVSLKIFLTALAIADDLGAVLVIAFFYTSEISLSSLGVGAAFMVVLLMANYLGIRSTLFYGVVGIGGLWLAFLMSGVHATIAGVLAAIAIPARAEIDEKNFEQQLRHYIHAFRLIPPNDVTLLEPEQYKIIERINRLTTEAVTPLQHLEHSLHPWVVYGVMPLFALANAGIELSSDVLNATFFKGVSMGVLMGLLAGKFIGVVGMSWLMKATGLAEFPQDMGWGHLCGLALLAGIGFTMSLFIADLAFDDAALITEAKVGIFTASLLSGVSGYFVLKWFSR